MKIRVKNISNQTIERGYCLFKPNKTVEVEVNDNRLFEIKSCKYLKVEELEAEIEQKQDNVFKCNICNKTYTTQNKLTKHLKTHEGDAL